jgi:hypothetical protein
MNTALNFLQNSQIGSIKKNGVIHYAGKACKGQLLKLIGLVHKLLRKLSVMNRAIVAVFTEFHNNLTYQWAQ